MYAKGRIIVLFEGKWYFFNEILKILLCWCSIKFFIKCIFEVTKRNNLSS